MSQNCGSFYLLISSGSFFLLTQAEKKAFSQLKALISAAARKKKNRLNRTSKKSRNFETRKPANYITVNLTGLNCSQQRDSRRVTL